ncbi:MAG: glycosyltransferase [Rikenellaceae bacterium]
MNIVLVLNALLPATNYGGTQRVIWYLAKELVEMKHNITLLAKKGSTCPFAKVVYINDNIPLHEQIPANTDIVHYNSSADPLTKEPYVVTIHGNAAHNNSTDRSIYVSRNHAERYNSKHFIYNGLDWADYGEVSTSDFVTRDNHHHFLAKASWKVKNVKGAVRIIDSVPNGHLEVLGGYRFNFKMGWRFTLSPNASFRGMVGGENKLKYLRRSRGLIFPVIWHEPFGLAITESLYFGAPVFGTQMGSLPELVTNEFGYLSNDEDDIAKAIRDADFSHKRCHEYAMDCFNSKVMALAYLEKYEQVINHSKLL